MKFNYLLLLAFLFNGFSAVAQKRYFVKASIVKNDGDTLSGYVDRVRDNRLSEGITFKQELKSKEEQKFQPGDLQGFTLKDEHVTYEQVSYQYIKAGKSISEKRFAILLLKGYCSLYSLKLNEDEFKIIFEQSNDHVFLAKKGSVFSVLKQSETMEDNTYILHKDYLYELKTLFSDCASIDDVMINKTEFDKKSMLKIFVKYNLCIQPGLQPQSYANIYKAKISEGINVSYTFFNYKNVSNSSGMSAGFFIAIINPAANARVSFSAGFNFSKFRYDLFYPLTLGRENDKISMYRLPLKGTYYLTRGKVAPFISFGVIPALVKLDYTANTGYYKDKSSFVTAYTSFGPGILFGKLYAVFLAEQQGIYLGGGTYLNFQLGYLF